RGQHVEQHRHDGRTDEPAQDRAPGARADAAMACSHSALYCLSAAGPLSSREVANFWPSRSSYIARMTAPGFISKCWTRLSGTATCVPFENTIQRPFTAEILPSTTWLAWVNSGSCCARGPVWAKPTRDWPT